MSYAVIGNIALFLLFFLSIPKYKPVLNHTLVILFLIGYSLCLSNKPSLIIRFAVAIWFILGAYYVKLPCQIVKVLFIVTLLHCAFLLIFECVLFILYSPDNYLPIRHFFLNQGWGDVFFRGVYYKIQIKGNALLPFVYLLSYVTNIFPSKRKCFYRLVYLLCTIIAGNFAFLISLFVFHFVHYFLKVKNQKQLRRKFAILLLFIFTLAPYIVQHVNTTLDQKKDISLGTRSDQATVLLEDMSQNMGYSMLGKGLGNTLNVKTKFRDYTDNIYFEVQALYFLNQLGFLFFFIFVLYNIELSIKYIKKRKLLFVYCCYVIYAFTNPYILDTNHIIVIVTLVAINNKEDENRMRLSIIQS